MIVPKPTADHAAELIPRAALIGAGVLVVATMLIAGVGKFVGYNATPIPPSKPVTVLNLRFEDRGDGAVAIYDTDSGRLVEALAPGSNNFVRGVLRGLARDRKLDQIGRQQPFRLTRWADGRLSLDDPTTGRHVNLEVFGPTNAGAFAEILLAGAAAKEKI